MQGPDFKVGKTDIIDSQGNRVVTTTTNENVPDGKSIWTIKREFDYDNDGVMDGFTKETLTYELNSDKLLERTYEEDNAGEFRAMGSANEKLKTNDKYLYETATGRLVKTVSTFDHNADGKIERGDITNYTYDLEGREINEHTVEDSYKRKSVVDKSHSYHKNGKLKKESYKADFGNDGKIDAIDEKEYDEKGRLVRERQDFGSYNDQNYEYTIKYNDKNGTAEIETKRFSTDGKNTLIGHEKRVVKVGKDGKFGKTISEMNLMPEEEPVQEENKPQYELPSYNPIPKSNDKKHPPMMGV